MALPRNARHTTPTARRSARRPSRKLDRRAHRLNAAHPSPIMAPPHRRGSSHPRPNTSSTRSRSWQLLSKRSHRNSWIAVKANSNRHSDLLNHLPWPPMLDLPRPTLLPRHPRPREDPRRLSPASSASDRAMRWIFEDACCPSATRAIPLKYTLTSRRLARVLQVVSSLLMSRGLRTAWPSNR